MGQPSIASFKNDLRFTNEQRQRLDKYFYPGVAHEGRFVVLDRSPGSIHVQRNDHIDCIVASRKGGSVTIEEKIVRWKGIDYASITIETHSNLNGSSEPIGDGWIATSAADYLLYAFQQEDGALRVNMFDLPRLRRWFVPIADHFPMKDTPNNTPNGVYYVTRCRVVALSVIPVGIRIVRDRIV